MGCAQFLCFKAISRRFDGLSLVTWINYKGTLEIIAQNEKMKVEVLKKC